ncbi:MAG TPA: T9SS type A sorting domain-containing protein [Bacteroidetes bacterium]|nr:T9SS type A sorting domain-containing protein [Bacteroidota bacterium]
MKTTFIKGLILLPFLLFSFQNIYGQGWVQSYDFGQSDFFGKMHAVPDGFYLVTGDKIIKTDTLGQTMWTEDLRYNAREALFTDDAIMTRTIDSLSWRWVAYDYDGGVLWDSLIEVQNGSIPFQSLAKTNDGGTAAIFPIKEGFWNTRLFFQKRDMDGSVVLEKYLSPGDTVLRYLPTNSIGLSDGGFLSTGFYDNVLDDQGRFIMRLGLEGNIIWEKHWDFHYLFTLLPTSIIETQDNGLILFGTKRTTGMYVPKVVKIDTNGEIVWEMEFPEIEGPYNLSSNITELPSGNLILNTAKSIGLNTTNVADQSKSTLTMLDKDGNIKWQNDLDFFQHGAQNEFVRETKYLGGNRLAIGGNFTSTFDGGQDLMLVVSDTFGNIFPHFLTGTVFQDMPSDCHFDGDEEGFEGRVVKVEKGQDIYYTTTDESGGYQFNLPPGDYNVSVAGTYYWQSCEPLFSVSIDNTPDTSYINVPMQGLGDCPLMEVDISALRLRLCSEGFYAVQYCNIGTEAAEGATVEIGLAEGLQYSGADMPLLSQVGQTLTFDLGTVGVGECGSFRIDIEVDCDTQLFGQTLCTEAHIYPDQLCDNNFTGPNLEVSGRCQNDSIFFNITNTGENMPAPSEYVVIEDNIILLSDEFQLMQNASKQTMFEAANGSTYHMIVAQDPNLPSSFGSPFITATVEGCVGEVNTGAYSQVPENDSESWISIDCHPVISSIDPNDKTAFPTGWTEEHIIENRTELDYLIRFQNTGTDTAFKVVVVDTLSPFLDPSTIRPGAGSHPFTFKLSGQGVAVFTFDNILLPDSTTNEAASHGFVKFHIAQKPGNEIGTLIENTAFIYFDFNGAVQTNTVFHTIGEPWVQVLSGSTESFEPGLEMAVFPNPFFESATLQLKGWEGKEGRFQLFNGSGQLVQEQNFTNQNFEIKRAGLLQGIYFFKIESLGKMIGTGKLVIK